MHAGAPLRAAAVGVVLYRHRGFHLRTGLSVSAESARHPGGERTGRRLIAALHADRAVGKEQGVMDLPCHHQMAFHLVVTTSGKFVFFLSSGGFESGEGMCKSKPQRTVA